MTKLAPVLAAAMALSAGPALAEFAPVRDKSAFLSAVTGKTLTRPLVSLTVFSDGRIRGKGALQTVTGSWQWQGDYFCRSLKWGDRNLGYDCQEVRLNGGEIRFTSKKGSGDSADFRLR